MTLHHKIGFGIFVAVGAALLVFGYLLLRVNASSASEREDRGKVIWQISMKSDWNSDSKEEVLWVTSYLKGDRKRAFISTKDSLTRYRERELAGFEEDLAFCPLKTFKVNGEAAVCVFGEVGVHSQNIQIVRFRDFSSVNFVTADRRTLPNIYSDLPNFDFNYLQEENLRIFVDNRDYDKDPLVDIIRTSYYLGNNAFNYLGEEYQSNEGLIK